MSSVGGCRVRSIASWAVVGLLMGACGSAPKSNTSNNSGSDAGPGGSTIQWAGTWTGNFSYTSTCTPPFGTGESAHENQTNAIQITGANNSLTATPQTPTSGWEPMLGSGSSTGMTITGQFPFLDNTSTPTAIANSSVSIHITSVASATSASGTISGSGQDQFGDPCSISGGTAMLSQ